MASTMPWAPIVAFMVASPLSSPEGLVYTAGLFGWPFAIAMSVASIALGLTGGAVAAVLERRGLLQGQARLAPIREAACGCAEAPRARTVRVLPMRQPALQAVGAGLRPQPAASCRCGGAGQMAAAPALSVPVRAASPAAQRRLAALPKEFLNTGVRLLAMFVGFAFIGYLLNGLVPAAWVSTLFGARKLYGVPLAATIGLLLYVSFEASLPLVRALLDSGISQGAVMAFLIAGSGTSIGAIAGALTIARWRVVALVVAVLWIGAMGHGGVPRPDTAFAAPWCCAGAGRDAGHFRADPAPERALGAGNSPSLLWSVATNG
jgi:uncharacterized membrane protein YraQ (UPF0718 family)